MKCLFCNSELKEEQEYDFIYISYCHNCIVEYMLDWDELFSYSFMIMHNHRLFKLIYNITSCIYNPNMISIIEYKNNRDYGENLISLQLTIDHNLTMAEAVNIIKKLPKLMVFQ